MADDERPDERDPEVAGRLAVDPLDDVTRRRLVSRALREASDAGSPSGTTRTWRWIAAAAAMVIVVIGGLALFTAEGGHDEQRATAPARTPPGASSDAPESSSELATAIPNVGDFGDLDQPTNLARLRAALNAAATTDDAADKSTTDDPASRAADAGSLASAAPAAGASCPLGSALADGTRIEGSPVAEGTGTLQGRPATVFRFEAADGSAAFGVLLDDPCELRRLSQHVP